MREIGGYIELDGPRGCGLHAGALALNSGRACLEYAIEAHDIRRIWLPDLLCDSVSGLCERIGVKVNTYVIGEGFEPVWDFEVTDGEWLYIVDYYGQLDQACVDKALEVSGGRLIVDEAQSLFRAPWAGADTLYTPRKFLGVSDGGFLYTDARIDFVLEEDRSRKRVNFLLGRIEENASLFYEGYRENNERFIGEPMKRMSPLTRRLIGGIDAKAIKERRLLNWDVLDAALGHFNSLRPERPDSPFMYPFLVEDGPWLRGKLARRGVYIPTLWPNVLDDPAAGDVARRYARDILPLPLDQRYGPAEMEAMVDALREEGVIPCELAGKRVAVLGGINLACEIVHAAKNLGMHVTVLDYNPPEESPAKRIADAHADVSVADANAVAVYVRENGIDGLITGYTDSILGFYADACEAAELPCYGTRAQFETFTDKHMWKALCREFGVPTACEYDEDILDLADDGIPLPLFVKPADGSGSRGVSVARDAASLREAVMRARTRSKNGKVVIEDYLEGPEITVFWLFIGGVRHVFLLGNRLVKRNQGDTLPLPVGYTFPASVQPRYLAEVAPKVDAMLEAQGVRNGMMFMQCIVVDGLPHVYDIGYRLTGSLEQHLTKAVAGYSPMDMLLRFAVTSEMTDDPNIWRKVELGLREYCYNVSVLMAPGELGRFEGLEALDAMDDVICHVKAHDEGEVLPPEARGELRQIALRVLGRVDEARELERSMVAVQDAVHIVSADGQNLKLDGLEVSDFRDNVLGMLKGSPLG